MNKEAILARKAAHAEMTEMIEMAMMDREMMINHGEEVGTVAEYIAGFLLRNDYSK